MEHQKNHTIPYRTYLVILGILITLTMVSVLVTQISLGALTVAIALLIASVKSTFVLLYFMHLKFESRFFIFATIGVITLIAAVIFVTVIDYLTK